MGIYEFAGCVVSYEPLYGLLRRRMETYRSDTERQPDITLDGTKEDYEKLRKQYPHLSIEECEYSCAGAEFYMKLLKHPALTVPPPSLAGAFHSAANVARRGAMW